MTLEPLEGRALLSLTTWTVNSLGDTGTGSGTSGDLRYVITQADQTPGDNTINFAVTGTITLNSALPDLSNTTGLMDIEGPGAASLTVARSSASGTPDFGIFTVDANVQAQLAGLTITGGLDGSGGGIDNAGTLTVTNSTIANNSATDSYGGPGIGGGIYNAGHAHRRRYRQRWHADRHQLHHRQQQLLFQRGHRLRRRRHLHLWHADRHQLHHRQQLG